MMDRPLVAILGPTASGKTELALRVAEAYSGEIVNCDSLQMYRDLDIGTAKTAASFRRGIPHHLFDVLNPEKSYSAGEYARVAREVIANISFRGHLPVVVGGTGFYFRALLDGLPDLPPRDESIRLRLAGRDLHRMLRRLDPGAARRIHPRDTQKLTRALEVRLLTGAALPPSSCAVPLEGYRTLQIGLAPVRELLVQAIATRTREMFQAGLIDEVRGLLASGLTGSEKAFESLGYQQAVLYLRGELSLEQAILSTEIETRQYAKRQLTWFRRDARVRWLVGFGSDAEVAAQGRDWVREFIESGDARPGNGTRG
jgi:tRNA dimethylallyltransferase